MSTLQPLSKCFVLGIFIVTISNATIINVPSDHPTIQSGINAATDGDTVIVDKGHYVENINFNGKNIVLGSLFLINGDTSYISQTVIDGNNSGSVVTFSNGETQSAILCGFTITGGTGTIDSVSIEFFGGGIFISGAFPVIRRNIIKDNIMITGANRGGGIAIKDYSNPLIIRNTIVYNLIIGILAWINYFGGGIWVDSTSNPVIGGSLEDANNIYYNYADSGWQLYRLGHGQVINAQYNYLSSCPPDSFEVYPLDQFDVSYCLENPVGIGKREDALYDINDFNLSQNYPNPFNLTTTIEFSILIKGHINLTVYDLTGREVEILVNKEMSAGKYSIEWNANDLPSGIYLVTMRCRAYSMTKKMLLLK